MYDDLAIPVHIAETANEAADAIKEPSKQRECTDADNGNQFKSATYADLIRGEKDDARLAALLMEIRCANCAFWGLCYRFADAERTIIEGRAKQDCTADLYNWLHQEVGAPGTMVSFPWGKYWQIAGADIRNES